VLRSTSLTLITGVALLVAPAASTAQDLRRTYLLVDRFQPSLPGEIFSQVSSPKYLGGWPLVIRSGMSVRFWGRLPNADKLSLDALWSLHPTFSLTPHESFSIFLGVPIALQQFGLTSTMNLAPDEAIRAAFLARDGARLLDPRLGVRARVFGYSHQTLSLHLTGQLHLDSQWLDPVANNGSDHSVRAQVQLSAAGCLGRCIPRHIFGSSFRYAIELGPHLRNSLTVDGRRVGHEVQISGAAGFQWRGASPVFGSLEVRGAVELMSWHPIDSAHPPFVSFALPLGIVLSQDVDLSIAPSIESPTLGRLSYESPSQSSWTPGMHLRIAYALHDRVLDRHVEQGPPNQRSPTASEEQDSDRDGVADVRDRCPNDPSPECLLWTGARPREAPGGVVPVADDVITRPRTDVIITRGVTTLVRPVVPSQRTNGAARRGANADPGFVFDDPVLARRVAVELNQLRSESQVLVAFALRIEQGARSLGATELRAHAFAAVARAIVGTGLLSREVQLELWLPETPGDEETATVSRDRLGVILLAKRRSSRAAELTASRWMPRSMHSQQTVSDDDVETELEQPEVPINRTYRPSDIDPLRSFLAN